MNIRARIQRLHHLEQAEASKPPRGGRPSRSDYARMDAVQRRHWQLFTAAHPELSGQALAEAYTQNWERRLQRAGLFQ